MIKNTILVEGAIIKFRNFSGAEGRFNPAGRRNFCVFLDYDKGLELEQDGWNIRWLEPRDEQENRQPYLQVAVRFEQDPAKQKFNPKVVIMSRRGKTVLNEDNVNLLDWAEFENVDLIIRPYNWEANGKSGVKAYLKSFFAKIVEDELESKYYDVPDSAENCIGGCGHCEACDGSCSRE